MKAQYFFIARNLLSGLMRMGRKIAKRSDHLAEADCDFEHSINTARLAFPTALQRLFS